MAKTTIVIPKPGGHFVSVLNAALEDAIKNECVIVNLDLIVLHTIKICSSDNEESIVGGELTYKILSSIPKEKKMEIIKELEKELEEFYKINKVPEEFINKDKVILSSEVIDLFKRISDLKNSDIYINNNTVSEISIDDVIFGIIYDSDNYSYLANRLMSLGLTCEAFFKCFMTKSFENLGNLIMDELSKDSKKEEEINQRPLNSSEFEAAGRNSDLHTKKVSPDSTTPTLDEFGIDMTMNASNGKYDEVIGRSKEVSQLIQILCCRKKNNAIIIGKAGTGKTALVELLAQKIIRKQVPDELKNKRLISLSTATLTAGTVYRGQLEQRIQDICSEVEKNREIIIFIDEFHSAVSGKSDDISQMLKPSLSRGEITLIAGTTDEEYKKYIEKDSALKRRFQKVIIEEPTPEETFSILKGIQDKYSHYHNVYYDDEVLKLCVRLSSRYLYDRNSPDRAIDLMDISGARAKLNHPVDSKKINSLLKKIEKCVVKKNSLVKKELYEEAEKEKIKERELELELEALREEQKRNNKVTEEDVASVVSDLVNVPVDKILSPDLNKLRDMAPKLKEMIIGQDECIDLVTKLLSRQFLGLRDENIPPSLYISGGTGTGKTYLAEQIAKTIFGSEKAMLRIDCGELTQPHTVTKLIGAPPSYVGYGEVALFDSVRERPQRLILVDEADKLCDEILNTIFLNILTTGFITLSNGIEVSFKDSIFIFTSNDGTRELEAHGSGIGFGTEDKRAVTKDIVMKAIKKRIRPEVINRFSGIVVFNNLGIPEMEKIYLLELEKVKDRILKKRNLELIVKTEVRDKIISELDLRYGARDLTRGIEMWIEDPVCDKILDVSTDISKKKKIEVGLSKSGEIEVKLKK